MATSKWGAVRELVIVPRAEIVDPKVLYLAAFHMHREGHDGYVGYSGQLPRAVTLNDTEGEVLRKMGPPAATGGGDVSAVLKRLTQRWLRYPLGGANLQFQFDANGRMDLATLSAPLIQPG